MKCFRCDAEQDCTFFVETMPCYHCGKSVDIEYNFCDDCGSLWKSSGEEVVEETVMNITEPAGLGTFMSSLDEEIATMFTKKLEDDGTMMGGAVHKCLNCNSVAFEVKEGKYQCPTCGFEWEVIDTDAAE